MRLHHMDGRARVRSPRVTNTQSLHLSPARCAPVRAGGSAATSSLDFRRAAYVSLDTPLGCR